MADHSDSHTMYLDDIKVGDRFISGEHTLDEQQIIAYASAFDPQPFHLDDNAARKSLFKGLAASGWHTASITMALLVNSIPVATGIIGAGGEIAWPTPTRPTDVLHAESSILEIKPSRSKPEMAIVTVETFTLNQHGDIRQRLVTKLMLFKRPTD